MFNQYCQYKFRACWKRSSLSKKWYLQGRVESPSNWVKNYHPSWTFHSTFSSLGMYKAPQIFKELVSFETITIIKILILILEVSWLLQSLYINHLLLCNKLLHILCLKQQTSIFTQFLWIKNLSEQSHRQTHILVVARVKILLGCLIQGLFSFLTFMQNMKGPPCWVDLFTEQLITWQWLQQSEQGERKEVVNNVESTCFLS